jgi:hypothetical protein
MNKKRRKRISNVVSEMETLIETGNSDYDDIRDELEDVLLEEECAFNSMPENLQYSMRGEESQEAIDLIETAIQCIDDENFTEAIDLLEYIY